MKTPPFILILLLSLILIHISSLGNAKIYQPLQLKWEWPIITHDLYSLDLDQDGINEFYLCTYNKDDRKGYIHVLNESAHLIWKTWVEGYLGESDFKRPEAIKFIWVGDLDTDQNLDIIAASEIKGGQANFHIIYGFEREIEPGHPLRPVRKWFYDNAHLITQGIGIDIDGDGSKEFITSSLDSNIYVFNSEGNVKEKFQVEGSVWDIAIKDMDNDQTLEIAVGYFSGVTIIKGASPLWDFKTTKRVFDVEIANVDDSNTSEIIAITENSLYVFDTFGNQKFSKTFRDVIKGLVTLDVDNDTKEEILLLVENDIYALDGDYEGEENREEDGEEGGIKWKFNLWAPSNFIFLANNKILIAGEKLFAFEVNPDYIKNEIALRYLEEAKLYYEKKDCENALKEVEKAKNLFLEVENHEGLVECTNIITLCSPSPDEKTEIEKANEYYSLGESYYNGGNLKTARLYLKKAMEIYLKWGYREETLKCDSLILKIDEKLQAEGKIKARNYYMKALESLENWDIESANSYANEALKIYFEIGDEEGAEKCRELLTKIENRGYLSLAESYFKKAQESLKNKDYENLSQYATLARKYYLKTNASDKEEEKISLCESFIKKARTYQKAERYYEKALQYFTLSSYENATLYAERAKELFQDLEYQEGVRKTNELLSKLKGGGGRTKIDMMQIFYISLIFGVILFAIIVFLILKKKV
jgi:tetratricopeptide (TPR) repeat protein